MIKFFPDIRTLVQLGPFSITWYALLIMSGAGIAYWISLKNIEKVGYEKNRVEDLFMGALIAGFLGARIWYVLFSPNLASYLANPISILAIYEGGLAIQGGLIAGVGYGYWYTKRHSINFWQWADLIVPNILIAQAIGRWGNFMNQEAFGQIVPESFYNNFPMWFKEMMFINGAYQQPTFLYESVANIIGWILIVLVLKRISKIKRGDLTFAYLMWYGATRFFIEGMRSDSLMIGPLRIAQIISLIFVGVGLAGYFGAFRRYITPNKPVLLFDFDGTIADTQQCIIETFRQTFAEFKPDISLDDRTLNRFLGPTLNETFSQYFSDEEIPAIIDRYREINHELHEVYVKPMNNAHKTLEELKKQGYRMGLVSNKATVSLEIGLDAIDLDKNYFEVILGSDQFSPAKPDPAGINLALELMNVDRGQVVYIGDTASDIIAGKRAGSFTIGYVFDKIRKKDLEESQPNRLIDDLWEITTILKEDHEWTVTMM